MGTKTGKIQRDSHHRLVRYYDVYYFAIANSSFFANVHDDQRMTFSVKLFVACILSLTPIVCACLIVVCLMILPIFAATSLFD